MRTRGYIRSTEVTRPDARWNVHDHLVIVPIGNVDEERQRLLDLWDDACRQYGLTPSSHAQQSSTDSAIAYILKPREGSGDGSLRDVLARAARGDAEAVDDWLEWDRWRQAHPHVRFRHTWVAATATKDEATTTVARDQHTVAASDSDLNRLSLLAALGVDGPRQQGVILGMSESSVYRRKRLIPEPRPGLIPFRVS